MHTSSTAATGTSSTAANRKARVVWFLDSVRLFSRSRSLTFQSLDAGSLTEHQPAAPVRAARTIRKSPFPLETLPANSRSLRAFCAREGYPRALADRCVRTLSSFVLIPARWTRARAENVTVDSRILEVPILECRARNRRFQSSRSADSGMQSAQPSIPEFEKCRFWNVPEFEKCRFWNGVFFRSKTSLRLILMSTDKTVVTRTSRWLDLRPVGGSTYDRSVARPTTGRRLNLRPVGGSTYDRSVARPTIGRRLNLHRSVAQPTTGRWLDLRPVGVA